MPSRRISAPDALAPIQEISVQPYSAYNSDNVNMLTRIVSGKRNRDFIVNGLDVFGYNRVDSEDLDTPESIGGDFPSQASFDLNWIGSNTIWDSVSESVVATIPSPSRDIAATLTTLNVLTGDVGDTYKISFTLTNTPKQLQIILGSESRTYDHPSSGAYELYLKLYTSNGTNKVLTFKSLLDQRDDYSEQLCYIDDVTLTRVINVGSDIEPIAVRFDEENSVELDCEDLSMDLLHPHETSFINPGIAIKDETMLNMLGVQEDQPVSDLEYASADSWIHDDPLDITDFVPGTRTLIKEITVATGASTWEESVFDASGKLTDSKAPLDDGEDATYIRKVSGDLSQIETTGSGSTSSTVVWAYVCMYYSYFKNPEPNKAYLGLVREENLNSARYGEDYLVLAKVRFIDIETVDAIIYYPDRVDWGYIDAKKLTYDHATQLKHWLQKPLNVSSALDLLASRIYNFKGMLYFQTHEDFSNWIGADTTTTDKYLRSDGGTGIIGTGHGPSDYLQWTDGADTENSYDLCAYVLGTNSFWRSEILTDGSDNPETLNYNLRILWSEIQQKVFEVKWSNINSGDWPSAIPDNWSYYDGSTWDDAPTSILTWSQAKTNWPSEYYAEKSTGPGGFSKINPFNPEGMGMVPGPDSNIGDVKFNRFLRADGTWQDCGHGMLVFENYEEMATWYKSESYEWGSDTIEYTITYDDNDSTSGSVPGFQTKTLDVDLTLRLNTGILIKTNYAFNGWNTKADGSGTSYSVGANFIVDADTILYAVWALESWTITYDANGATGAVPSATLEPKVGGSTTISGQGALLYTDKVFGGWDTVSGGGGTAYAESDVVTIGADDTLYAQWLDEYTITYDKNAAFATGTITAQTKTEGVDITLGIGTGVIVYTNYEIVEWNTQADGLGDPYAEGGTYTADDTVTMYAQWISTIPPYPLRISLIDEASPYRNLSNREDAKAAYNNQVLLHPYDIAIAFDVDTRVGGNGIWGRQDNSASPICPVPIVKIPRESSTNPGFILSVSMIAAIEAQFGALVWSKLSYVELHIDLSGSMNHDMDDTINAFRSAVQLKGLYVSVMMISPTEQWLQSITNSF